MRQRVRQALALLLAYALFACGGDGSATREAASARDGTTAADTTSSRLVIREELDGLWGIMPAQPPLRLTALRVAGFDYDSLAAMQREGEVILYWAAAPALSPEGRRVAYATNREAVVAGERGQSIWLLDLEDGSERALLYERGRSFRPVGWLADDVVYIGDTPGVWAVDPASGSTRRLAEGTWIAAAANGRALLVADGVPDHVRLRVLTSVGSLDVPPAPGAFGWLPQGAFSPDGGVLRLDAAADSGRTRQRFVFDLRTRELTRVGS